MSDPVGQYFVPGINYYTPQMQQSPGVGDDGFYTVSLGAPALATVNAIVTTANGGITNAAKVFNATLLSAVFPFGSDAVMGIFGRCVSITGATAGDNAVCTVRGADYMGQPVSENITLNGTTTVQGVKAFKRVDSVSVAAGNANASSTIQVGTSAKLGLPFKTNQVVSEFSNDVLASAGTLVQPNITDPQTATSTDPRGVYTTSTTLDGAKVITITARSSRNINSNNNGGLHGLRHFFA